MHFCVGDTELCSLLQIVVLMLGVLTTTDFVASKPQSSPANTYLPPDQGYQYHRPTVPFPSPVPGPSGPAPTYPRPSPVPGPSGPAPTYPRPSPGPIRPSPTPTYGPPPPVPQGPPRPPPTYGGGQVSSHIEPTESVFMLRALRHYFYNCYNNFNIIMMALRTSIPP